MYVFHSSITIVHTRRSRMQQKRNISRRDFLRISTMATAGTWLAACAPAASPAPGEAPAAEATAPVAADVPQVIRRRVPNPLTNVWPNRAGGEDREAVYFAYSPPYWLTADGGTEPGFALSHDVSDDFMTWTLNIDPEAVFSNGKPITADAVKKCWEWGLRPENEATWGGSHLVLRPIKGTTAIFEGNALEAEGLIAVDERTLRIEFHSTPYGWEQALTAHYLGVFDAEAAEEDRESFLTKPVTSGPYVITLDPNTGEATLVRNTNWWRTPPNIERIENPVIQDEEAAFIAFDNGEIDMLMAWLGSAGPALERWPDLVHMMEPSPGMWYMGFNSEAEPTDDIWVRRALLHSIDRHTALAAIAPDAFRVVDSILNDPFTCFNPDLGIPYDPDRAREELAQSRYGSGANVPQIRAYYPAGRPVFGDILTFFQDQWRRELGIEVQVQEHTGPIPADWHIDRASFGATIADESYYLSAFGRYDGSLKVARNIGTTDEIDALLREADSMLPAQQAQRCENYQEAERLLIDNASIIPMVSTINYWVIQPWVTWDQARLVWPYPVNWTNWMITEQR
jgi:ABC-type transport system substrate-binding protein